MATNPDLNILDTGDKNTLLGLQNSQALAIQEGNIALAATLGNAINALLVSSQQTQLIPPTPPPTTRTLSITPPPPRNASVGSLGSTSISFDQDLRNIIVTAPPTSGGGSLIGGNTNLGPQTPGGNTPVDGSTPRPGFPPPGGGAPCAEVTYRLGEIREVQTSLLKPLDGSFASIGVKQCALVADVFECCGTETLIGTVLLGYATISKQFRKDNSVTPPCTIAEVKSYYDIDSLSPQFFVENALSVNGTFIPATDVNTDPKRIANRPWVNQCPDFVRNTRKVRYSNFKDYFSATYPIAITIKRSNGQGISLKYEPALIYDDKNPNANSSTTSILNAVPASCTGKTGCLSTPPPPPPPPPGCIDTWNIQTVFTEEQFRTVKIPNGYVLKGSPVFNTSTSETIRSGAPETVPNNPCYKGFREVVKTTTNITYTYEYNVRTTTTSGQPCVFTKTVTVVRVTETSPVWVETFFDETKRNLKECLCQEEYEDAGVLLDSSDPCGCKQYNLVRVKLKCPGETEYTYSTEKYTDGIPAGLNIPVGHKLDPYYPFVLRADCQDEAIKIYHPLILGKDIVEGRVTANTRGLFNLEQSMSCYHTSSLQSTASKDYYYEVADCDCDSTPYFAVAYGNVNGSGSISSLGETNDTSTRAVYSQYRLLALEEPERKFKFYDNGTQSESEDIYAINFYRNALSDRIDPGNFEIALRPLNGDGYANNVFTGSNVQPSGSDVYTFIDNSGDRSDLSSCSEDPYVSYDIVSGSLDNGIHDSGTGSIDTNPNITTYGKFYPNLGIMIFDPAKLDSLLKFNTVTGSNIAGDNAYKLFASISGSGNLNYHMKARNVKYKTTNHYYVRVSPPNANYSNNPTFVSDTKTGKLLNSCFQKEPVTYVTSVGLYNDRKQLLAIAKLSKPIKKTPDDDLLIKIRLNW